MAELKRQELKVGDITDVVEEATGLVKENYLVGLELTSSLWEKNLREKVLNSKLDSIKLLRGGLHLTRSNHASYMLLV